MKSNLKRLAALLLAAILMLSLTGMGEDEFVALARSQHENGHATMEQEAAL